jgi:HNH endonuclease
MQGKGRPRGRPFLFEDSHFFSKHESKDTDMKNNANPDKINLSKAKQGKADAEYVWKQLEDVVVPRLRLSVSERAVYCHLLRHSRLEGKGRCRFSIASLGRGTRLSATGIRAAVRRLARQGALRLVQRSKAGHVVEVRVPDEIRASRCNAPEISERDRLGGQAFLGRQVRVAQAAGLEEVDFMRTKALRHAIHAREGGRCFYCLRRLATGIRCVDHVVPLARSGRNSYRNLVSACLECNTQKGEKRAKDFLRWLYREGRLTVVELNGRVRALQALAAGKVRPVMQAEGSKEARK